MSTIAHEFKQSFGDPPLKHSNDEISPVLDDAQTMTIWKNIFIYVRKGKSHKIRKVRLTVRSHPFPSFRYLAHHHYRHLLLPFLAFHVVSFAFLEQKPLQALYENINDVEYNLSMENEIGIGRVGGLCPTLW